ncbi:MAG: RIP metalloprotease RseP [Comamonadaceae bacterium]|nr:RIP metalloprotease RseP [Comamonadaceae bacterium]
MLTIPAFIVAISLLIAVHEYGHYRMALACGVKVLRFSIGFGKPLWRWQVNSNSTEFVLALFPLGGYVKMLDEREAPVDAAQRHLAFNNQPLRSRAAIVAAGPLANLLLAVVLYSVVNWVGVDQPAAVLARPADGTIVSQAGLAGGERVLRASYGDGTPSGVNSYEDLRWVVTQAVLEGEDAQLVVLGADQIERQAVLKLSVLDVSEVNSALFSRIGLTGPFTRAVIGDVMDGGAAARAGLLPADEVLAVNAQPVSDGQQLRALIRSSGAEGRTQTQVWKIVRNGGVLELPLTPEIVSDGSGSIGRINAFVGARPEMVLVRFGVLDGLWRGIVQTWDVSTLTLKMMGKMLIGEASVKNLSGPLTIADYAGKSANLGLTQYLVFLALISVSLGVLNLLPLPILDGGHLMYYLWEGVTGRPVSDRWMQHLQQGGVALLTIMMSIAIFNDLSRLLG